MLQLKTRLKRHELTSVYSLFVAMFIMQQMQHRNFDEPSLKEFKKVSISTINKSSLDLRFQCQEVVS